MLSQSATVEYNPKQLQTFDKVNMIVQCHSGFDLSFWSFVLKIFATELSFRNLMLGEWRMKISSPTKIVPAHRAIYFSQLVKAHLLPKTIVSQAQLTFFFLEFSNHNSSTKCEISSKLTTETPERHQWHSGVFIVIFEHIWHVFLLFLLLTYIEQVNARRNTTKETQTLKKRILLNSTFIYLTKSQI